MSPDCATEQRATRRLSLDNGREPANANPNPSGKAVGDILRHESPHVIARGVPAASRLCRLTRHRPVVSQSFLARRWRAEITRKINLIDLVDLVIVRKGQPCSRLHGIDGYQANKYGDD